jgi:hypothetical protein
MVHALLVGGVHIMPEIGFVTFAAIALHVGQAVLPAYRSKFSKHCVQQPQLLVI